MKIQYHAVLGVPAACALIPVLGTYSAVFFAATVLVDSDHYLDYLYRNKFKDYSIRGLFTYHKLIYDKAKENNFLGLSLGHTVEFLLLVYAAGAVTDWIWLKAVLWGIIFHMLVDIIHMFQQKRPYRRCLSVIEYIIRWNWLKRRGMHPEELYRSVLEQAAALSKAGTGKK